MPTDARATRRAAGGGPRIRRADLVESDRLAGLMLQVRLDNVPAIPPPLHPLDDMRRWMRDVVFARYEVWTAEEADGELVGMLVLGRPDWVEHLYVAASHTGQGLGSRFLALAEDELAGDIQLWTFQSNVGARRFYERHGFVAVETTAGDNEEQAPDVRYLLRR
jgi:GNAT superfamily N-acetyltransferase